jgi:hypothetical protein
MRAIEKTRDVQICAGLRADRLTSMQTHLETIKPS